jgi:hypothetical protein
VEWSKIAKRWIGNPSVLLKRIAEEIARLNEGWAKSKAEEIMEFRRELMS